jgi:hypothetical protein
MLDRLVLPQGTLDLLILRTLAQRHLGKSVGRTDSSILQANGKDVKVVQELLAPFFKQDDILDVYAQALAPTAVSRCCVYHFYAQLTMDLRI